MLNRDGWMSHGVSREPCLVRRWLHALHHEEWMTLLNLMRNGWH